MIETSHKKFLYQLEAPIKTMWLKVLADQLFLDPGDGTSFSKENTLLIDDDPEKSVCNEFGNAIFPQNWDHGLHGDNFLIESLAPWLKRLHKEAGRPGHLREYVEANRIGEPPLAALLWRVEDIVDGSGEWKILWLE